MVSLVDRIRQNIETTRNEIDRAAQSVGRSGPDVRLVIVTKTHPIEVVRAVVEAGGRLLGENYPEETVPKIKALGSVPGVEWHMIGHVQSRKSGIVAENFQMLHSLDSLRLAERLDRQVSEQHSEKRFPVLLEFNAAGEESKFGWYVPEESSWDKLLPDLERVFGLAHLKVCGLMTMPPLFNDPQLSRPFFVKIRKLRDFVQKQFPQSDLCDLSMGTSIDYPIAIQEGATLVRVGQAILGARPPKA